MLKSYVEKLKRFVWCMRKCEQVLVSYIHTERTEGYINKATYLFRGEVQPLCMGRPLVVGYEFNTQLHLRAQI
jgi:hypothetical protein